ncbi:hypothetical protein [Haloplanus aerogenes]|uniref:Uncharacterized protein n=1 Tax=Haloplanus aerogenes TaxID=660522 RepID=A0A3M0DST1_9EURY|nr:hypothetical protein [Haloplanus aerogenes]AZH25395.1 hypothetical protein DU502_08385 [Haloplanus aerogenes]RMB25101.1 hypothetical protein ATH50_0184 [Haloplanus aerogenes]
MSGDDGLRMNRRRLLTAISTVGAVGALTGRGAAAYLTDREAFADNRMTAGSVTLATDGVDTGQASLGFTIDDYGFANRDAETVCLGLGEDSNPGWVWIRACPDQSVFEDALDASLTVDDETVYSGSLGGLFAYLSGSDGGGVLLTALAGDGDPVNPGADSAVCLTVAIWAPTTLADEPGTVRALKAASPFTVIIDAYAEQSRHVPTPRRPVAGLNPSFTFPACEPTGGSEGDEDGDGYAISNVSLCASGPVDPSGITWTVLDPDTGTPVTGSVDEPFAVRIESTEPIQYAVVKAGPEYRRFDVGGATTFTVTSTGGTLLDVPKNFARCACEGDGVKLDWLDTTDAFGTPVALSCGDESGGKPPEDDASGEEPTGSDGAPETSGGGSPPNGDDK